MATRDPVAASASLTSVSEAFSASVAELADAMDLVALGELAATTLDDAQKAVVAEDGFLAVASVLEYDLACGKGSEGDGEVILDCVEQAEKLLGRPLWEEKGRAYQAIFEETDDVAFAHEARVAFEAIDAISHLSYVHYQLATAEPAHQLAHWERALAEQRRLPPDDRGWHLYVTLLYEPLPDEVAAVTARRLEEQAGFEQMSAFGSFADIQIVRACEEYPVPRAVWLAHACAWDLAGASRDAIRDAAHELARNGALERATELYRELLLHHGAPGPHACWLAQTLEKRGLVDEAAAVYAQYLPDFWDSLSSMIQYAEFLERACSTATHPPSLSEARKVAEQAEKLGEGWYSGPGMVLARLALREGDEVMARFALQRLLLLHELCIDDAVEKLRAEVTLPATRAFLDETLRFMEDARPGYGLAPCIRWPALEPLSPEEVDARWTARKLDIVESSKRRATADRPAS